MWSVLECGIGLIATSLPLIWHDYRVRRRARRHPTLRIDGSECELPVLRRLPGQANTACERDARSVETV